MEKSMSMIACDGCNAFIDSDADPFCFVELGNQRRLHAEVVWCESCRERKLTEEERNSQYA
jgi:hypothetical protein